MARRREKLTDERIEAIVAQEIASSQTYDSSELATKRQEAIEYYDGIMRKWPSEKGRSSVVDMTTLDTISWILPGLLRLFAASDRMAIAEPTAKEHEEWADQATTGINHTFWKECNGYGILYDATFDSLLHGDGIVKHWWDDTPTTKVSFHSGLDELAFEDLLEPEDSGVDEDGKPREIVEVLKDELVEYTLEPGDEGYVDPAQPQGMPQGAPPQMQAEMPGLMGGAPEQAPQMPLQAPGVEDMGVQPQPQKAMLHDVKIKRTCRYGKVNMQVIAPEDFLISSDATSLLHARMVGNKQQKTRSELIEMGFDYDKVMGLTPTQDDDATEVARRDDGTDHSSDQPIDNRAMEQVTLFELYPKLDVDGDGMAETIQVFFTGYGNVGTLLEWAVWEDEPVYSNIPCYPVPHRWNANSVFDRSKDTQEVKTALVRGAIDSIYGSINPQRVVVGRCLNPDELSNPSFGGAIMMEEKGSVSNLALEFTGEVALKGIEYFDAQMERRTGVSRTTMALDPEALQNTTASANQLAHDSAYSQIELIARNQAELGWKPVFRNVLKLMVRHQRRKTTVRLTNKKWAKIDPRYWNADMDITINTGLGSGSRDRDIAVLSSIQSNQVAVASILREAQMPGRALEMVPMIIDTVKKSGEAAGVRSIDDFYPEVSPEDLQAAAVAIKQKQSQPSPEMQAEQAKLQAQMQMEQGKAQLQMQSKQAELAAEAQAKQQEMQLNTVTERMKSQAQVTREAAQLEADMKTKEMDLQNSVLLEQQKQAFEAAEAEKERAFKLQIEMMKLQAAQRAQEAKTQADAVAQDKKTAADGEARKADGKHKTNEALIKAGKNPVGEGVDPAEIIKALMAPKRIVRGPDGRATHVETVTQ